MILAASSVLSGHVTVHQQCTKQAGRQVFEVRSHVGAGWRGAVIREPSEYWLVAAAVHDEFHNHAWRVFTSDDYLPTDDDIKVWRYQQARDEESRWRQQVVASAMQCVAEALEAGNRRVHQQVPAGAHRPSLRWTMCITEAQGGVPPADFPQGEATCEAEVCFETAEDRHRHQDDAIGLVIPLLQPDPELVESVYDLKGRLLVTCVVSHSRLLQIAAAASAPVTEFSSGAPARQTPVRSHYVSRDVIARAYVEGLALRGICGVWFVPTADPGDLPVCERCEEALPTAQKVLEMLRQRPSPD